MNKIGYLLDDKMKKLEIESKKKPEREAKNKETISKFNTIFARFEEIGNSEKITDISNRVKILCKNMLDDREKDWDRQRK
jgi:hypothetical protein